jgi:hypothetical protein
LKGLIINNPEHFLTLLSNVYQKRNVIMQESNFPVSLWQTAQEQLKGAYDWHIHTDPSIFWRRADDKEALAEAVEAGMAGIGYKAHEGDTAARAQLLKDTSPCAVIGGITLNHFVGGLNPAAVEISLGIGGRVVWLPTLSARQHVRYYLEKSDNFLNKGFKYDTPDEGISVLDGKGKLVSEVYEIIELVKSKGAILSTGHLSPEESLVVASAFKEVPGTGFVVFGHPDVSINQAEIETQKEFVRLGGIVEKCVIALTSPWGEVPIERYVSGIKELGVENCMLSTDAGGPVPKRPSSPDILTGFIAAVLEKQLLSEKELRKITTEVASVIFAQ